MLVRVGNEEFRTPTVKKTCNPAWDDVWLDFYVHNAHQLVEFEVAVPDGVAPGQQFRVALDECVPVAAPRALPRASPLLAPPSRARAFRFGTIVLTVPDDGPEVMTVRIPRGSRGGLSEEI